MEEDLVIKNGFRKPSFVTSPSNYSQSEIITMQQDAVKRVNEMRQQAMRHIGSAPEDDVEVEFEQVETPPDFDIPENIVEPQLEQEPITQSNDNLLHPTVNSLSGIFDKLDLDSEKIILIGLMLLLMNEGADNTLLMALGYILL